MEPRGRVINCFFNTTDTKNIIKNKLTVTLKQMALGYVMFLPQIIWNLKGKTYLSFVKKTLLPVFSVELELMS